MSKIRSGQTASTIASAATQATQQAQKTEEPKAKCVPESEATAKVASDSYGKASGGEAKAGVKDLTRPDLNRAAMKLGRKRDGAGKAINHLRQNFQKQLQSLANKSPDKFKQILTQIYGDKAKGQLDTLLKQAQKGKFPLPANVRFADSKSLQGNNAAYSKENGGTILLNKDLLSDPKKLQGAFNEEMGHHLDQVMGGKDTRGDEGQMFQQALEKGRPLTPKELAAGRADKDTGTITVDGKKMDVEFQSRADKVFDKVKGYLSKSVFDDTPGMVTNYEVGQVHKYMAGSRKMGTSDFNNVLGRMAGSKDSYLLNRYVNELAEADTGKVKEFAERLAKDVNPATAKKLLQKLGPEAWGHMMKAYSGMSESDQRAFARRFGGANKLAAKSVFESMRARMEGLADVGSKIGLGMKALNKIAPLPAPIKKFIGLYADAISTIPKAFAGMLIKNIQSSSTTSSDIHFVQAAQGAGFQLNEALDLLTEVKSIYN